MVTTPLCTYTSHIITMAFQHQQQLISMSLSTLTSSHLNVILNINIISSQCHSQHQHHLISMALSTTRTSSYINIIINNNIISYQHYHKHQHRLRNNNIVINVNITLYQLIFSYPNFVREPPFANILVLASQIELLDTSFCIIRKVFRRFGKECRKYSKRRAKGSFSHFFKPLACPG